MRLEFGTTLWCKLRDIGVTAFRCRGTQSLSIHTQGEVGWEVESLGEPLSSR